MSLLIFDTTYLIDADRAGTDLDAVIDDRDDVAIAAITVAELLVGVELSSGRSRHARQAFVEDVLTVVPILDYDRVVAEAHAVLLAAVRRQGRPRGAHDLIIAATARATRREVITADSAGFIDLPGVVVREL
ncbi:MAG: PIN domain-containing protein [Acidimicrobiales bacterium]